MKALRKNFIAAMLALVTATSAMADEPSPADLIADTQASPGKMLSQYAASDPNDPNSQIVRGAVSSLDRSTVLNDIAQHPSYYLEKDLTRLLPREIQDGMGSNGVAAYAVAAANLQASLGKTVGLGQLSSTAATLLASNPGHTLTKALIQKAPTVLLNSAETLLKSQNGQSMLAQAARNDPFGAYDNLDHLGKQAAYHTALKSIQPTDFDKAVSRTQLGDMLSAMKNMPKNLPIERYLRMAIAAHPKELKDYPNGIKSALNNRYPNDPNHVQEIIEALQSIADKKLKPSPPPPNPSPPSPPPSPEVVAGLGPLAQTGLPWELIPTGGARLALDAFATGGRTVGDISSDLQGGGAGKPAQSMVITLGSVIGKPAGEAQVFLIITQKTLDYIKGMSPARQSEEIKNLRWAITGEKPVEPVRPIATNKPINRQLNS